MTVGVDDAESYFRPASDGAGSRLAQRLPLAHLRQGFALLVVLLGVTLLTINLPKALG